ncbi:MAG: helix-turn-helix domain-containing protein [Pseudonocardiaceae bacterium]
MAELIERRFGIGYTLRGVGYLLHRRYWSWQVPPRPPLKRLTGDHPTLTH